MQTNEIAKTNSVLASTIETVLLKGDLSVLKPNEKLSYYKSVCESVGLNPLTKPFEFIKLNGKEVLYATRACTDQLRFVHKVSIELTSKQKMDNLYVVSAKATDSTGRTDESTGAVDLTNLKGDALANAMMKAETKAKRRATLSICGLALLDETEVATIPEAKPVPMPQEEPKEITVKKDDPLKAPVIATYEIPFGKWKGRKLDEIPSDDLANYAEYITHKAQQDNKPIKGSVADFLNMVDEYFADIKGPDMPPPFDADEQINF